MLDLCVIFVKIVQSLIKKFIKTDWTQPLPLPGLPLPHLSWGHQDRLNYPTEKSGAALPLSVLFCIRLVAILPVSSLFHLCLCPHWALQYSFNLFPLQLSERVLIYVSGLTIPLLKILQWLFIICDDRSNSIVFHCQGQSHLGCWLSMQISGPRSWLLGLKSLESGAITVCLTSALWWSFYVSALEDLRPGPLT